MRDLSSEEKNMVEAMKAARTVQEFLWGDINEDAGLEEFRRMFRKRVIKLDEIEMSNPYRQVELRKRLLQVAAIAINMLAKLDNNQITHDGTFLKAPSNLPQYTKEAIDARE